MGSIDSAQKAISRGKTEKAIKILMENISLNEDLKKSIILLSGRYQKWKHKDLIGLEDPQELRKVEYSILEILDQIKNDSPEILKSEKRRRLSIQISISIGISLAIIFALAAINTYYNSRPDYRKMYVTTEQKVDSLRKEATQLEEMRSLAVKEKNQVLYITDSLARNLANLEAELILSRNLILKTETKSRKYLDSIGFYRKKSDSLFIALQDKTPSNDPKIVLRKSQKIGGGLGGGTGQISTPPIPAEGRLISIQVRYGRLVNGIGFEYEDAGGKRSSYYFGGQDGTLQTIELRSGVTLIGISGRAGKHIDNISFHFSDGSQSPNFGGNGGSSFNIELKQGDKFAGFIGRSGRVISAIGLQYWTNK